MNRKKTWEDIKQWLDENKWEYKETENELIFVFGNGNIIIDKETNIYMFDTIIASADCDELLDELESN